MKRTLIALFALLASGCLFDTSADVPFGGETPPDMTMNGGDAGPDEGSDAADADATADAAVDAGPLYPRDTLPSSGMTCDDVPTSMSEYDCNPVTQDCPYGRICNVVVISANSSITSCDAPAGIYTVQPGQPCNTADQDAPKCVFGYTCNQGECRRFCEFEGAVGCEADEFCESLDLPGLDRFGVCLSECR